MENGILKFKVGDNLVYKKDSFIRIKIVGILGVIVAYKSVGTRYSFNLGSVYLATTDEIENDYITESYFNFLSQMESISKIDAQSHEFKLNNKYRCTNFFVSEYQGINFEINKGCEILVKKIGLNYVGIEIYEKQINKAYYFDIYKFNIINFEIVPTDKVENFNKSQAQFIPIKNERYFYVDLLDENLFGVTDWFNDTTDYHMLKLGLIFRTSQECVKKGIEMLDKLGLVR